MSTEIWCFRDAAIAGGASSLVNGAEMYSTYASVVGPTVNSTTPILLPVDTERFASDNYQITAGQVEILNAGRYAIDAQAVVVGTGSSSRSQFEGELTVNGNVVVGSELEIYVRQTNFGDTAANRVVLDLQAGDLIGVQFRRTNGAGNGVPQAGGVRINVASADAFIRDSVPWENVTGKPIGVPNGVAPLDANNKVPSIHLPDSVVGGLSYLGLWDASTNTPTITSGSHTGLNGDFYIVETAGTTAIDGNTDWEPGDAIVWNDTLMQWDAIRKDDLIVSVNGQIGAVVLDASSIPADDSTAGATVGPFSTTQEAIDAIAAELENLANLIPQGTSFIELPDTPADYETFAGSMLRVNVAEDGLEFFTLTASDIPSDGPSTVQDDLDDLESQIDNLDFQAAKLTSSPGSGLNTSTANTTLDFDTVEYIDSKFSESGGVLTWNGQDCRLSASFALPFTITNIPLLSGLRNATAGLIVDGELIAFDTKDSSVSLGDDLVILHSSADFSVTNGSTIEVVYTINSVSGLISGLLGLVNGILGIIPAQSGQITHLSVHQITAEV